MSSETGARKAVWSRTFYFKRVFVPVRFCSRDPFLAGSQRPESRLPSWYSMEGQSLKQMPYSDPKCYPPDEAVSLRCFATAKVSCCCAVLPDKPQRYVNPGRCILAAACVGPVDYVYVSRNYPFCRLTQFPFSALLAGRA